MDAAAKNAPRLEWGRIVRDPISSYWIQRMRGGHLGEEGRALAGAYEDMVGQLERSQAASDEMTEKWLKEAERLDELLQRQTERCGVGMHKNGEWFLSVPEVRGIPMVAVYGTHSTGRAAVDQWIRQRELDAARAKGEK